MPKYVLHEIDPFTGWEETRDPPIQFECHPLNLPRKAHLHADFYKIRDSVTGKVVLEKLPQKVVFGPDRVIDLYYGAIEPGQREALFVGGDPAHPRHDAVLDAAEQVIRNTLALRPTSAGVWFPGAPEPVADKREDPLSMAQVGHIDYQFPNLVVRVNFLSNN